MGSRTILLVLGLNFTLLGNLEARVCGLGFIAKGSHQCHDIDECKELDSTPPCGSNATCYNTRGSFFCQCQPGFRSTTPVNSTALTGECNDVDECKEQTADCPNNSSCVNTPGSYTCNCQSGYKLTESRCEDIDECNVTAGICEGGGTCQNQEGSYICLCLPGYSNHGNKQARCSDIDECNATAGICGGGGTCQNQQGSYSCLCVPGYSNHGNKQARCSDIDECNVTAGVCGEGGTCQNQEGRYSCLCLPGYSNYGNKQARCSDIDECNVTAGICEGGGTCQNQEGSYICLCLPGYSNHGNKQARCSDMDECKEQTADCPNNSSCVNTPGSYTCICQSGYKLTESRCEDIDECNATAGICGEGGTCQNQAGSYSCLCLPGYSNHGNKQARCSVLTCDQFKGDETPGQNVPGLAGLLSLMRNSCLALSNSGGRLTGDGLLENVFTQIDSILSQGILSNSREVSRFLGAVEDAMKLIAPQLRDNHTTMETDHTEAEIAVRRGQTPPIGPISLANDNARLDTSWETATGNGTYPGLTLAGLVCYKTVERYVNNSFQYLTETDTDTDTDTDTASKPNYQISSKVVTAFVSNPATDQLTKPVILTFKHLQVRAESSEMNYTCVFWRVHEKDGAWSSRGCTKVTSNATYTVCSCSHLSSFAVLMALYPVKDTFELRLLTWLGLSVSVVCLLLCILTFWLCRSIQGTRTTIHLHLCVCLFIADLVFLSGISHTQSKGGCRVVAGLLHLFFLGSFSWMLLEGVQLYLMVVLVFNTTIRPLYLYAVGYGLPLAIVIISAITYPDGYGTTQHCWLSLERGFIWSFFGPVCTIIFLNAFIFIITVWRLAQKFSSLNPDLSNLHKIKVFTVTAVAQLCVLGTMWIFGVFQFQEDGTVVMTYLFTILNSLQGALLFIMHCLLNKTVREEYCQLLSCICTPQKKRYSDFSTNNPSSSQSQGSRRTQNTGELQT
ncbi:adhesion G protein-coupled receptor E5-like isoform X4 [Oncorhynchus mykiss]|uniref:adhesion G protein-coupled receptor E5-like isoform X4 n=1 Tax=Oncorhynchus mykiss TaxID=8022 RepID=UPI0018782D3E|nr:adhesion G protein-coupled receptor E5-like isoform X4 [Oncorhynchus mykiss]